MAIMITRQELRNLQLITSGGEANIYEYDKKLLLKEFKPGINMKIKREQAS